MLLLASIAAQAAPPVCVIDDFGKGIDRWKNEDAGMLTWVQEPDGARYLRWKAGDDGIGHIILKALERKEIDVSQYDILQFRYRVSGKPVWNINPIIQQYPFMHGFRALYYSIDTLDIKLGEWQTYVQPLDKVENSWPDSFSPDKQEFQFEIAQEAGAGVTQIDIDDIVLMRNVLKLNRSYTGQWSTDPQGTQYYTFALPITNSDAVVHRVQCRAVPESVRQFRCEVHSPSLVLQPSATGIVNVTVTIPAEKAAAATPYYGEIAVLTFTVDEMPGLELRTMLPCGVRPKTAHPNILCSPDRARDLRQRYAAPDTRKTIDPLILRVTELGKKSLGYHPQYPPCANRADGYDKCLIDGTQLVPAHIDNLPEASYQCPKCGRFFRGLFYDAAMNGWYGQHMANAEAAQQAGIAYLVTGEMQYAVKAAEILHGYIDTYLRLPLGAGAGVHTHIASSGATRIGGSFMQEQNWLANLAVGLDCIRDSGCFTDEELRGLEENVFTPSATNLMDHRVGLMNLQWMIDKGAAFAGLATDNAALVARAVYGDHGAIPLLEKGFLADGFWRENPSYINVMANEGYPLISTLMNQRILPYTPEIDKRFKAMWLLAAPDNRFPTLGTGGPPDTTIFMNGVKSIAKLSNDPEIAWIDRQQPFVRQIGLYFSSIIAAFQAEGTRVPADQVRPITPGTLNLPDYGVAVLRTPGSDMYAALDYGRHLVHGHFNKLSVNAYGKGGWFVRNVWGGYGEGFSDYLESTPGSSTIMVDGKRQDADTGEMLFLKSTPAAQMVSAREIGAWKDVEHERALAQTADWLVMIDRCQSATPHTYDWLYHGQGVSKTDGLAWADGPAVKGAVTSLGEGAGYKFFLPADEIATGNGQAQVRYQRQDTSGVRISLLATQKDAQLFRTQNTIWKHEGLIFRAKGQTVGFLTLFEPYAKGGAPQATLAPAALLNAQSGRPVTLADAQGAVVTTPAGRWLVVVNYTGQALKTPAGLAIPAGERVQVLAL